MTAQVLTSAAESSGAADDYSKYPNLFSTATARIHYTGKLVSTGAIFDSSEKGEAPVFTLGKGALIPCWDLAIPTLRVGDTAVLTCTAKYAYGDAGSPPQIPPNAALKFKIRVLELLPEDREEL